MDSQSDYQILVKTETPILTEDKEIEENDIIEMIREMADETEGKKLDKTTIQNSIQKLVHIPNYGHYFLIVDKRINKFCGMNLVTYEYNINSDQIVMWIQSVFVEKAYRNNGLFKKLLGINENFVKGKDNFEQRIKLYMERTNETAEKVYFKVGFKVTDETLYELDYNFDDVDFLTNNHFPHLNLNEHSNKFSLKVIDRNFESISNDCLNLNFKSILTNNEFKLGEKIITILKIYNDETLGKIIYIHDQEINAIVGCVFIFYEFSDWRNSIFWWVYDIAINENYSQFVSENLKSIIYTLVKLNYDQKSCGLRILVNNEKEQILQETVLIKSHYVIYEKNF